MIDPNIRDIAIETALGGSPKKSLIDTIVNINNISKEEATDVINSFNFHSQPKRINYRKFSNKKFPHTIKRLPFPFTQIYKYDDFLDKTECKKLIRITDEKVSESTLCDPEGKILKNDYRTSYTRSLFNYDYAISDNINSRIATILNLNPKIGETLQIQKYHPGEYYKEHNDYFHWFTPEHDIYTEWMGQRTWTFMVYLNDVEKGGETFFKHLNLKIKPKQGMAIFWNNLFPFGGPNWKTLHEALPPVSNNKYVITKWWRSWSLID